MPPSTPQLTLTAQLGRRITGGDEDFDGIIRNWVTTLLGSFTQPIFARGKLKAELEQAKAMQEEAAIAFRQTLLDAGNEVNDLLVGRQYARRAIILDIKQMEKLQEVLTATELRMRYDSEVNYLQVLLARQAMLEARLSLLSNQYSLVESDILLYKALGGGAYHD